MTECQHHYEWQASSNEEGWFCPDCDARFGFRPDLDRQETYSKVYALLLDLQESDLLYVSNGTLAELIVDNVASRCLADNTYDQQSIVRFILEDQNTTAYAAFWRNRAERWFLGGEPIRTEQEAMPF